MKLLKIISVILCVAALGAVAICIFTDWNDWLYLSLALGLSACGNFINFFSDRHAKNKKENEK